MLLYLTFWELWRATGKMTGKHTMLLVMIALVTVRFSLCLGDIPNKLWMPILAYLHLRNLQLMLESIMLLN